MFRHKHRKIINTTFLLLILLYTYEVGIYIYEFVAATCEKNKCRTISIWSSYIYIFSINNKL